MAEYIEREALILAIERSMKANPYNASLKRTMRDQEHKYFLIMASTIPAADAVEVVRCKDCKHNVANWDHDELDATDYSDITCDYFMTDGMHPNDFCSCGERRNSDG